MDAYEAHYAEANVNAGSPRSAADTCYVCMRSRHTGPCSLENCPQKRKVPRKPDPVSDTVTLTNVRCKGCGVSISPAIRRSVGSTEFLCTCGTSETFLLEEKPQPTDRAVGNSFKRVPGACPDLDQEPPHPDEAAYREMVLAASKTESPAGEHYRKHAGVQPIDLIEAVGLGYHEGAIVKYVSRWRDKNGVEDLKKARWFLDRLILLWEPPK